MTPSFEQTCVGRVPWVGRQVKASRRREESSTGLTFSHHVSSLPVWGGYPVTKWLLDSSIACTTQPASTARRRTDTATSGALRAPPAPMVRQTLPASSEGVRGDSRGAGEGFALRALRTSVRVSFFAVNIYPIPLHVVFSVLAPYPYWTGAMRVSDGLGESLCAKLNTCFREYNF